MRVLDVSGLAVEVALRGLSGHPRRGTEVFVSSASRTPGEGGARFAAALTAGGEWKARGLAAGPVFEAAFIDGWLDGHRVQEVLSYAVSASSLSAETDAIPTRSEALRHLGRKTVRERA